MVRSSNFQRESGTEAKPSRKFFSRSPMRILWKFFQKCYIVPNKPDRWKIVNENRLCPRCLQTGHNKSQCTQSCKKCSKDHHISLCPINDSATNNGSVNTMPDGAAAANNRKKSKPQGNNDIRNEQTMASIQVPEPFEQVIAALHGGSPFHKTQLFLGKVTVANRISNKEMKVDCFVDPGATPTVMTETLAKELDLPIICTAEADIVVPGAMKLVNRTYDFAEAVLKCDKFSMRIQPVLFKHEITGAIRKIKLSQKDKDYVRKHKLHLSDSPNREGAITPQLLIGMGDAGNLIKQSNLTVKVLPSGLFLMPSAIGYMTGGVPDKQPSTLSSVQNDDHRLTNHDKFPDIQLNFLHLNEFETNVKKFLCLDQVGQGIDSTEREIRKQEDNDTDKYFDDTVRKDGNKYVVKYRLKNNWKELPNNRAMAYRRLESELRKLKGNPLYLEHYNKNFQDQLAADQIEVVDETKSTPYLTHYLAHAPVLRPDKPTTPLRVVYDASAKMKGKICLNDAIYQGPNYLEQIPALLLRVRSKKNLIIADVEKAFLQVRVDESQRDMLRFLWLKDKDKGVSKDNIIVYRFKVTPFGVNQSPYILGKVIQYHLKSIRTVDPTELYIISQLLRNIYVDNVLFCADDIKREYYDVSKKMFTDMGMNLREYISNDASFNAFISPSDKGKESEQKLLGIVWDPVTDSFKLKANLEEAKSKRQALSEISSQYDPLGWLTPLVLNCRLFVQDLWKEELKWDDPIRSELTNKWNRLRSATEGITAIIPRHCQINGPVIRLVLFSDASARATGACIYNGNPTEQKCRLLISQNKLAPKNCKSTIPKLELEGCLIGFSLVQYTVDALSQEFFGAEIHIFPFCDSTTVIHWLYDQNQHDLGPYVSNRVKKYRKICNELTESGVTVHPIRYVNTKDNPADFITRGLESKDMNDSSHPWWTGPKWLSEDINKWPQTILPAHHDQMLIAAISWENEGTKSEIIDTFRFSTLARLCKTMFWVRRYVNALKKAAKRRKTGDSNAKMVLKTHPVVPSCLYTAEEHKKVLITLARIHQNFNELVNSVLAKSNHIAKDKYGIWRGNTNRISHGDNIDVNPIYLVSEKSNLVELLIRDMHEKLNHQGVNAVVNEMKRDFWIPRIRSIVKRVLKKCTPCNKANNLPFKYPISPPLPKERTIFTRPFEHIGLDFIGPFKNSNDNVRYILIFTCFTTRAVHLEAVESMSTESMLMAFKRFIARRGQPSTVLSDKAPTFRTAKDALKNMILAEEHELQAEIAKRGIEWKFTTAHSPWQGGIYERLVSGVKQAMNKTIGRKKEEFSTLSCEIEASMNCRPLTYSGTDDEHSHTPAVVRPIDFISPNVSLGLRLDTSSDEYIPRSEMTTRDQVLKYLDRNEKLVEKIKHLWSTTYITDRRDSVTKSPLQSYRASPSIPKVGDLVLIIDESGNTPKNTWPMACIHQIKGHSITLRTPGGRLIERPHNLVIPLELSCYEPEDK